MQIQNRIEEVKRSFERGQPLFLKKRRFNFTSLLDHAINSLPNNSISDYRNMNRDLNLESDNRIEEVDDSTILPAVNIVKCTLDSNLEQPSTFQLFESKNSNRLQSDCDTCELITAYQSDLDGRFASSSVDAQQPIPAINQSVSAVCKTSKIEYKEESITPTFAYPLAAPLKSLGTKTTPLTLKNSNKIKGSSRRISLLNLELKDTFATASGSLFYASTVDPLISDGKLTVSSNQVIRHSLNDAVIASTKSQKRLSLKRNQIKNPAQTPTSKSRRLLPVNDAPTDSNAPPSHSIVESQDISNTEKIRETNIDLSQPQTGNSLEVTRTMENLPMLTENKEEHPPVNVDVIEVAGCPSELPKETKIGPEIDAICKKEAINPYKGKEENAGENVAEMIEAAESIPFPMRETMPIGFPTINPLEPSNDDLFESTEFQLFLENDLKF